MTIGLAFLIVSIGFLFVIAFLLERDKRAVEKRLEQVELDQRFDQVYRSYDERLETLSRETQFAREELSRDLRNEILEAQRYNDKEHEEFRTRFAALEE